MARALNGLGEDYLGLGLYNDAFAYYQEALQIANGIEDSLTVAIAIYNIGRVFKKTGRLAKSSDYIRRSMEISAAIDDKIGQAYSMNDLGEIFLIQYEVQSALSSLETALGIADSLNEDAIIPSIITNIAESYKASGDLDRAYEFYDEAADLFTNQNNSLELAKINLERAKIKMILKDSKGAKILLDSAMEVAEQFENLEIQTEAAKSLSEWYEASGQEGKSLEALKKSLFLRDSLEVVNRDQQFSQTILEYEIGRKDLAIAELNAQQQLRQQQLKNEEFLRNVLVVILAFTGILLFTLYRNSVRSRKANEKLLEHQKEIEEKTRELQSLLSMKDKFFSIVSHDLRSPINGLVGILDMLDDGNITQDELVKVTKSLKTRLGSTRKMLDNLLAWALVEMNEITLNWEQVNLNAVVDENLKFFNEVNDKNIKFKNEIDSAIKVKADKNMLDLILRNLVANSIKFMDEEGQVIISSSGLKDGKYVVNVNDNGVGMAKDQIDKVFDTNVLYTTRGTANEKGTGLGLKLCKEFIEKMGGTIWVESVEGKGSTFNFTLSKPDKD